MKTNSELDELKRYRKRYQIERKIKDYNFIRDSKDGTGLMTYCLLVRLLASLISKYYTFKWERFYG